MILFNVIPGSHKLLDLLGDLSGLGHGELDGVSCIPKPDLADEREIEGVEAMSHPYEENMRNCFGGSDRAGIGEEGTTCQCQALQQLERRSNPACDVPYGGATYGM
jgi:hypothetical protein